MRNRADYSIIENAEIQKIEELNKNFKNNIKNVFYVKSKKREEGLLCVYWEYSNIKEGNKIDMKGFFTKDNLAFIVKSLFIRGQEQC